MSDFLAIRGVQVRRHEWLGSMPFRQDPWCILSAPCAALDVRVAQRTRPKVAGGSEAKRAKTLKIYRFDPDSRRNPHIDTYEVLIWIKNNYHERSEILSPSTTFDRLRSSCGEAELDGQVVRADYPPARDRRMTSAALPAAPR
jgi:hypothetical protein